MPPAVPAGGGHEGLPMKLTIAERLSSEWDLRPTFRLRIGRSGVVVADYLEERGVTWIAGTSPVADIELVKEAVGPLTRQFLAERFRRRLTSTARPPGRSRHGRDTRRTRSKPPGAIVIELSVRIPYTTVIILKSSSTVSVAAVSPIIGAILDSICHTHRVPGSPLTARWFSSAPIRLPMS